MPRGAFPVVLGLLAWAAPTAPAGSEPDPPSSVILIIVDTLRIDRLAACGSERPVMPRLDEWLERAVIFEQARSPSSRTLPSFASLYDEHRKRSTE